MHLSFPSIRQFKDVFARETFPAFEDRRTLTYRAKIKLHGTNVGVRVAPDGTVTCQGRNTDLNAEDDAYGFFPAMMPLFPQWATAACCQTLTFFGEWAGPGVARGDAIQQTDAKRFYLFALGVGETAHPQNADISIPQWLLTNPEAIAAALPDGLLGDTIRVLPWELDTTFTFNFQDEGSVERHLTTLNTLVDGIAEVDPYVARTFGIQHPGEGFVLMPDIAETGIMPTADLARIAFKTKTEKHRVAKQGKPATMREPLPETVDAFIDTFVTQARVTQGIEEVCQGDFSLQQMGRLIGWFLQDIAKEAGEEMAALNVDRKRLQLTIVDAMKDYLPKT